MVCIRDIKTKNIDKWAQNRYCTHDVKNWRDIMGNSYVAEMLPLKNAQINYNCFFDELIDATAKLEVYKEKVQDSKVDSSWFLPTLQQKEALSSSLLEGTQATLDGILINQTDPSDENKNINEVLNYYKATSMGLHILNREKFSNNFFKELHQILMEGNVRKPEVIGEYRTEQNYIGKYDQSHSITFIPPAPELVPDLMDNLISYVNEPHDSLRPLVRIAIIHAQFETIHPFMDGNGRVGRMLIPLYLYYTGQINLPCFFISEALEHDKLKYYNLLNNIRDKCAWNEWIKFFLDTVKKQCEKYIEIVTEINKLYEHDLEIACKLAKNTTVIALMEHLYKMPVTTAKQIVEETKLPLTSVNRLLTAFLDSGILISDGKQRNRRFYYYNLLEIIR